MTETRVCAFCGGRPVTREHIWPAWFAEWLHATDDPPLLHGREGEQGVVGAWEAQKIAATVRRFCAICNNGWMSEIEAEAQAIMMPLLVDPDEAAALSPHDQEVLARWAYKTALVGDFSWRISSNHKSLPIPRESYQQFRSDRLPPRSGSVICITGYNGPLEAEAAVGSSTLSLRA